MAARARAADDGRMTTADRPLDIYRRFQDYLLTGQFARLPEVADVDHYTENCVGLTGWTTGLDTALRNYQEKVMSAFTDMSAAEEDVIESGDALVLRSVITAVHSGVFMGIPATGRTVRYDAVDMFRVAEGRICWRFLLCDWKGLTDQLTAA